MLGFAFHDGDRAAHEALLAVADHVGADGLLELEDQAGADRLDDRRRAALFAVRPGRRGRRCSVGLT